MSECRIELERGYTKLERYTASIERLVGSRALAGGAIKLGCPNPAVRLNGQHENDHVQQWLRAC